VDDESRSRVIVSILERDAGTAERRLEALPQDGTLAELRADRLPARELDGLVRRHGGRLVVTVRRRDEDERHDLLRRALDAGARYVDLERGSREAELLRDPGTAGRAILSDHGAPCREDRLERLYGEMAASGADVIKIVPRAANPGETAAIHDLLQRAAREGRKLACFALGRAGALSRLLAPCWGSWATYGAARPGAETAEGQFTREALVEAYGVEGIGAGTRRF